MKHDFSLVFEKSYLSIEDFAKVKRRLDCIDKMLGEAGHNYTIESYCINYCSGAIVLTGSIIGSDSINIKHTQEILERYIQITIYDVYFNSYCNREPL